MYVELLENPRLRAVFNVVRKTPGIRFSQIRDRTGLHDPDVAWAIRELKALDILWPQSIPTRGERVFFSYSLSPLGKKAASFLERLAASALKGAFRDDPEAKAFARQLASSKV